MSRAMFFNFVAYSGWDVLKYLLPKKTQTRLVALSWLSHLKETSGSRPNILATDLVLQMPWGSFRIITHKGDVEQVKREQFVGP